MPNAPFGKSRVADPIRDGGEGPYVIPQYTMMSNASPLEEDVEEEKTFDYRFGTGQNVGDNVRLGRYAAEGGIMNAVPRKRFFLGGIGRAIGKSSQSSRKV